MRLFEKYDLSKKTDDKTFEKEMEPLRVEIGVLTRTLWEHRVPIIIVVEGWNASGITMATSELIQHIDPRGFSLYSIGSPNDEERAHPSPLAVLHEDPGKRQDSDLCPELVFPLSCRAGIRDRMENRDAVLDLHDQKFRAAACR